MDYYQYEFEELWSCDCPSIVDFLLGEGIKYLDKDTNLFNGNPYWIYLRTSELAKALSNY